ncbi:hypothetical protein F8388_007806 [Cannabis sativa]|uniref:Uncharacterized protein n=1 Tax=Cannabis sativa TaxID=3483 RepID=A0A7J6FVX8_CANSA|nr:hypothetical protein F8388_007806 [Cannabis sativa]
MVSLVLNKKKKRSEDSSKVSKPRLWKILVIGYQLPFYKNLSSLASNPTSQLNILRHDRNPLGVNGAQIGVFEQTHQVSLCSLLKSRHSTRLESKIGLEILSDFPNQSLEWKLTDQKLSAFLATVPGLKRCGFFTPPVAGADFLAALVASCFLGAFPPVDFLAVCLVRAIENQMNRIEREMKLFVSREN